MSREDVVFFKLKKKNAISLQFVTMYKKLEKREGLIMKMLMLKVRLVLTPSHLGKVNILIQR